MKHPIAMIIVVTTFIVICLLPLRTANLQFPDVEALPKQSDTRIAYEKYEEAFNKTAKTHADVTLVVETKRYERKRKFTKGRRSRSKVKR